MRRTSLIVLFLSVPALAGLLTVGVRSAWDHWGERTPAVEYTRTIDLGVRSLGEVAVGRFKVKNNGRGALLLNQFMTSCSCAGVERERDGSFYRVQDLQLAPGDETELLVRVWAAAQPGTRQAVQVFFNTNDPAQPTANLEVVIPTVRGVFAKPAAVVFGTLSVGASGQKIVNLYDIGAPERSIGKVRSTHPERFEVRLLALEGEEATADREPAGKLVARLQVVARTKRRGPLDGYVEVCLGEESHQPVLIPVAGEVVATLECWPDTLVLPRYVRDRFLYSGEVLVVNRAEKPIHVEIESSPPGLSAQVCPVAGRDDQCLLRVEATPAEAGKFRESSEAQIRLRVRFAGGETNVEVPIVFTGRPS